MKVHALDTQLTVYTVGHSTHSLDDFFELLRAYSIERLVDVRTVLVPGITPSSTTTLWARFCLTAVSGTVI